MDWVEAARMLRDNPTMQIALVGSLTTVFMAILRRWWRGSPEMLVKLQQAITVGLLALVSTGVQTLLTATAERPAMWGNVVFVGLMSWVAAMGFHTATKRLKDLPKVLRETGVI